jgi:hypothetical protein
MDQSVRYITNCTRLMTPKEFAALKWMSIEAKAKACDSESMRQAIRTQWLERWQSDDPETLALIEMGWERFLQHTHDRILRDHPNEVGRCPKCGKLTATLQAKQCFACGYDWHDIE